MLVKAKSYIKNSFTIKPREKPYKLWCFYPDPYRMGLTATGLTALVVLSILLVILLLGGGALILLSLIGGAILLLFYGVTLALGALGLLGFTEKGGDSTKGGCGATAFTGFIAYSLYNWLNEPVNKFVFGQRGWDSSDVGIFDYGLYSFEQMSTPMISTLGFVQENWQGVLLVILSPAIFVFTIALLFITAIYLLNGVERSIQYVYGMRFPCPVCGERSEPALYSCVECGQVHEVNLVPSVYGVVNHFCTNEECQTPLPTMMLNGRNTKLNRSCPKCESPLNDVTGTDKHIALVGGRNAGKTCLLVQATKFMLEEHQAYLPEADQKQQFEQINHLVEQGEVPPQTQRTALYKAFQLVYQKRLFPYHLYLYDIAGENFEHVFDAASYPFYQNLDAIIFMFDPYSIATFRERYGIPENMAYSSQEPFEVLPNLIQALEKYNSTSAIKKIKLNVMLAKSDTGYLDQISTAIDSDSPMSYSDRLKLFVSEEIGEHSFVSLAQNTFKKVTYHEVSALGRVPDPGNRSPFIGGNVKESIKTIFAAIGIKTT